MEALMIGSRFTEEHIIQILYEVETGQQTVIAVCRTHNISEDTFNRWLYTYRNICPAALLRPLKEENTQLKHLLAERERELYAVKEALAKFM
jgi:putative transposase